VLKVSDIMSGDLFSVSRDATLDEVAFQLNADMVSGAPVIDDAGKIVGIVSKTDLVDVERDHKTMAITKVGEVMRTDVRTVTPATSVRDAVELMSEHSMHRLLVADAAGKPVGIVTSMDIVHALAKGEL
jgi:predicted transcriptional regulator